MTKPNIAFAVQVLRQFMHAPKQSHLDNAVKVVKYIKRSPGLGSFMSAAGTQKLIAFDDSNWGACVDTGKPVTGYSVIAKLPFKLS